MAKGSPTEGVGGSYKVIDKAKYFNLVGYEPHPKQWLFHNSTARFRLPCCGRRFGKSKMAGMDIQPKLLLPKQRHWIVGPTYDLAEKEFRVIWDTQIIQLKFGLDRRVKKAYNKKQGTMFIEYPWGTRLECRSADHPENLVGEALNGVIMSEAAKHRADTFERYIRAALADFRGNADFPTTPEGQNWYHKMWQVGQDPDEKQHASWRFPSWDNPHVYPDGYMDEEIQAIKGKTTKEWFDQEIGADFTAFVGKIYGAFQEDIHVKKHVFNPDWKNYIAFDWGYTNPMVAVEFQVDPFDRVYVWRMWYKSYMMLDDFLKMIKNTPNPDGYHLDLCFGDSADPGAAAEVTKNFCVCIADPRAKSGTVDEKGAKRQVSGWREGVDLVNLFLKIREASDNADLTEMVTELDLSYAESLRVPSLTVDHSCKDLIREFNNYRSPDTGRQDKNVREAAQAFDDHDLDALRYGLMHVFRLGLNSHLSEVYKQSDFLDRDLPAGGFFQLDSLDRAF